MRHAAHGGFRCADCGVAMADFAEAGTMDDSRVANPRRRFERKDGGTVTRSTEW